MEVKRGEVYDVDLNPVKGSELKGKHPAVVISIDAINKNAAIVIICPITDALGKDSPVHIPVDAEEGGLVKESIVHCGQIRAIDKERLQKRLGELSRHRMAQIGKGLKSALGLDW